MLVPGEALLTVSASVALLTLAAWRGDQSPVGSPGTEVLPAIHTDKLSLRAATSVSQSGAELLRLNLVTLGPRPAGLTVTVPGVSAVSVETAGVGHTLVTPLPLPAHPAVTLARSGAVASLRVTSSTTVRLVTQRSSPARQTVALTRGGAGAVQTSLAGPTLRAELALPARATPALPGGGAGALTARGAQGDVTEHSGPSFTADALKRLRTVAVTRAAQEEVTLVAPRSVPSHPTLTLPGSVTGPVTRVTALGAHCPLTARALPTRPAHDLSLLGADQTRVVGGLGLQAQLGKAAGPPRELLTAGELD